MRRLLRPPMDRCCKPRLESEAHGRGMPCLGLSILLCCCYARKPAGSDAEGVEVARRVMEDLDMEGWTL